MFSWNKYPLLRIFGSFLFGILLAFSLRNNFQIHLLTKIILTGIGIAAYFFSHYFISYKNRMITGCLVILLMAWMGYFSTSVFILTKNIPPSLAHTTQKVMFIGDVKESPVIKAKSVKVVVKIFHYQDSVSRKQADFDMILYLQKNQRAETIRYGDRIIFYIRPQSIAPPKNPEEFNYQRYLEIKNIHLQGYVKNDAWEKIDEKHGNPIMIFASGLRYKLLQVLNKGNLGKDENAIISAILLGADDKLDPELAQQYASAGVSHILSVSGMHVGIIFMIVNYLLFFLSKSNKQKFIKTIILLVIIWLYACITGMSPSVMRATTMFTFVALGNIFERQANTYNSLLTSLFFLSCFNPLIIYEVGIQLSYSAVLGIVWLQKPVKDFYIAKTKAGNYVWEIIAVSLVAQLLTFPLSMFYFHQFPNYFLLANIAVISLTPFVVGTGILCLIVSFWHWGFEYLSIILNYMIKIMNYVVSFIEKMPFSTIKNISINGWQLFLLYVVILCGISAFLYKKKSFLFVSLFCVNAFLLIGIYHTIKNTHTNEMIVYSLSKGYVIDCMKGNTVYRIGDSLSLTDMKKYNFQLTNYRIKKGIKHSKIVSTDVKNSDLFISGDFICFGGIEILVVNKKIYYQNAVKERLKLDYVLLDHNPPVKINHLLKMVEPKTIIFSTNNSSYKIRKWKAECDTLGIHYHDLRMGFLKIRCH